MIENPITDEMVRDILSRSVYNPTYKALHRALYLAKKRIQETIEQVKETPDDGTMERKSKSKSNRGKTDSKKP